MKRRSERTVKAAPKRNPPTKNELEKPISIHAILEELAKILLTPAKVVEKPAGRQAK